MAFQILGSNFIRNHGEKLTSLCWKKDLGKVSSCAYHCKSNVFGFKPKINEKEVYIPSEATLEAQNNNGNLHRYISAYRKFGHLTADVNPLYDNTISLPELDPGYYGLKAEDVHSLQGLLYSHSNSLTINEIERKLKSIFCQHISAEFMHLSTLEERDWFSEAFESINISDGILSNAERSALASHLLKSQVWDNFLAAKFPSLKRYGGEGAESMMGFFHETFRRLAQDNVEDAIIGKAHRGRLNLQTVLLELPPAVIFRKISGQSEFSSSLFTTGDVVSHLVSSLELNFDRNKINVTLLPNPSHLEAVNPVVCGFTRSRQKSLKEGHYAEDDGGRPSDKVVGIQVHGDAALSGQGIIQENLMFSNLAHFSTGGTIHLCVNNQIGYTMPGARGRSTLYATDVAKLVSFPVIHVNGNKPEEVVKAARLAVDYQRKFRRDVFVDLLCFRRWGHNELDNPRFTNPRMYSIIDARGTVPDLYAESLVREGVMTDSQVKAIKEEHYEALNKDLKSFKDKGVESVRLQSWSGLVSAPSDKMETWDTGVNTNLLKYLGAKSVEIPETFKLHPNLKNSHVNARLERMSSGTRINWATGEALAIASLLHQGYNVRLCGQDVGRGTFSQRHCMLVNQETSDIHIPLNHLSEDQRGFLEVANSILSEEAVLGFEYGMSLEDPYTLCIWEAQFGDFFNGAQIILDTMVSSGEIKWAVQSGLTLILPHGYDGAGPEHTSCRFERFLQNCDSREDRPDSEDVNWNIAFPTTPAQYFHLLRRQMVRNYRKPLIVIGPKILLRLSAAESTLADMAPGTHFLPVIGDNSVSPENIKKVIFVTGKHYYTLVSEREARSRSDTAIIRVESLCPFPTQLINDEIARYKKTKTFIWAQEEHRNMGGWTFVNPRFRNLCGTQLRYAGREVAPTPAVGIAEIHQRECQEILDLAFKL